MIVYDGIIDLLQPYGGISVLFQELNERSAEKETVYYSYERNSEFKKKSITLKPRFFERYRSFNIELNREDIFHSTYYRLPECECNTVTTVHDFTYERFIGGAAAKVHSYQKNKAILNSDKIICVSHHTANDLLQYCAVPESKIEVVYNGVSDDYYPLALKRLNYVVFVGSRVSYKNFHLVVEAVSKVPDLELIVVGGGPISNSESSLLTSKLFDRFKIKGFLSNKELNTVYNQAIALVYPSEYEGFGIPVIEAMKSGCPVIARNTSSIPEVAGDSAILLNKSEPGDIYEAILALDSSSFRDNLVSLGLENAKRFSWENCFKVTKELYSKF